MDQNVEAVLAAAMEIARRAKVLPRRHPMQGGHCLGGIGNSNTESAGSTKAVVKGSDRRAFTICGHSAWRRASSGGPLRSEDKRDSVRRLNLESFRLETDETCTLLLYKICCMPVLTCWCCLYAQQRPAGHSVPFMPPLPASIGPFAPFHRGMIKCSGSYVFTPDGAMRAWVSANGRLIRSAWGQPTCESAVYAGSGSVLG
ncbi:hypothetical protein GGI35DRAFT_181937 [Trichoderma velutinum]